MKTLVSAVQPSNHLTLGNYLGSIKNSVGMQDAYECMFFAVDLHALTVRQDPKKLPVQTLFALATYLAAGIDPAKSLLFIQSHVPQHSQLAWLLTCFASMGELGRMTQFKDKTAKVAENEGIGVGLFTYPVLMAADILLYGAEAVPVGDDQRQHLQLARDLALRFNHFAQEEVFKVPEPIVPAMGARIMSLQDPERKMSKSDPNPAASIFLGDSNDDILRKVKRSVTDSRDMTTYENPESGIRNLLTIYAVLTGKSFEEVAASFEGKQYGHVKKETAEVIVSVVQPIRERIDAYLIEKAFLQYTLTEGAKRAQEKAAPMLTKVSEALGLILPSV